MTGFYGERWTSDKIRVEMRYENWIVKMEKGE